MKIQNLRNLFRGTDARQESLNKPVEGTHVRVSRKSDGAQPFVLWSGYGSEKPPAGKKENSNKSCLRKNLEKTGPIGIFLFYGR